MKKMHTKNDLYQLLSASAASAAFGAAIETGLLWKLAETPMDGEEVARFLNIPSKRCHYWLQLLESLGILDKGSIGYSPSSLIRNVILQTYGLESWRHLAVDERERSAGVHNLSLFIREPGSVWGAQGMVEPKDYVAKMIDSPVRASEFTRMLYEVHQYLGRELAELLDMTGVSRLMDAGGGSGVESIALLRKYADLTSTVIDIENVCVEGRKIAAEEGLSDRLQFLAMDLTRDDLPGGFDMVLVCDVGLFGEDFYRRLWQSLKKDGRLVIVSHFSPAENSAPPALVEWTFLDSLEDPTFSVPTVEQARMDLIHVGFQPLPGAPVLSDQRIVLQALK